MPFRRTPIRIFQLGNPLYANATVSFFAIDESGDATTTPIALYTNPNGTTLAANPQTLDSNGRLQFPIFHDSPFIAKIGASEVPDHQTAPWYPDHAGFFQGDWVTAFAYVVGDTVRDAATDNVYECLIDHVSGVLETDIAAGDWRIVLAMTVANAAVANATAQAVIATDQAGIATAEAGIATIQAANAAASAAAAALSVLAVPAVGIQDVAAAATTDIGSPNFTVIRITGTAAISALGTVAAGVIRDVRTAGSPIFVNGANLVIPWGADLPAEPNDHFRFVSNGGGVWQLEAYFPAGQTTRVVYVTGAQNLVSGLTYGLEAGAGPLTLPTAPQPGDQIRIVDSGGICGMTPVSMSPSGSNTLAGQTGAYSINMKNADLRLALRGADWGVKSV